MVDKKQKKKITITIDEDIFIILSELREDGLNTSRKINQLIRNWLKSKHLLE